MAVQTITYEDKQYLNQNADIPATNKVQDTDMNEIKAVVNNNATILQGNTTYSLIETDTGKTWINGKPIYRKVIDFGTLPNNDTKEINPNIQNFERLTEPIKGFTYNTSNSESFPLPFSSVTDIIYNIDLLITGEGTIRVRTKVDRSTISAYIIIEYTKTTD
jgi:hypothetical protein